ncbi:TonB-dependent siderophore receptor [Pseudomonas coronafaciens pv. zizaniae]|nr:TonB-dependent siderophore receptor [Pseudomonas coronafaciens pv. zizaniae]
MPRPASSLHPLALAVLMACAAMPLHAAESSVPNQDVTAARSFSIPAGDLGQVLNSFSEQAGLALAFDPALTRGKRSTGLQGTYSTDEAIARLLGGSGLRARALSANRYRIEAAPEAIEGSMELQATNISGASQFETAHRARDRLCGYTRAVGDQDRHSADRNPAIDFGRDQGSDESSRGGESQSDVALQRRCGA